MNTRSAGWIGVKRGLKCLAIAGLLAAWLPEAQAQYRFGGGWYGGYGRGYGYSRYPCGSWGGYGSGSYQSYCPSRSVYYYPSPAYGGFAHRSTICSPFGYRSFPYVQPHIYVVPQAPVLVPAYGWGPRFIMVYSPNEPASEYTPEHELPPAPPTPVVPPAPTATTEGAWQHLEDGKYKDAVTSFSVLGRKTPDDGELMLGYGLAAALAGDKITAVYALRRALELEDEGTSQISLSPTLQTKLRESAAQYQTSLRSDPKDLSLRFLLAATSYWAGNTESARKILDKSIDKGDTAPSTLTLKRLLDGPTATTLAQNP